MSHIDPPGPGLAYTSVRDNDGGRTVHLIDREPIADPRERAICRALLLHALALLDASEPPRRITTEAQR
ncbi:hypothetical protein [Streptomyces tendae]|uniref:hypothetical protein n=1 Tax=Streptomyces tendae TaxID=1932 RepID=UPI003D70BF4D